MFVRFAAADPVRKPYEDAHYLEWEFGVYLDSRRTPGITRRPASL